MSSSVSTSASKAICITWFWSMSRELICIKSFVKKVLCRYNLVASCIFQAAQGLKYIQENGLIHRDIKPGNIFATKSGTIKILDLGLALLDRSDNFDPSITIMHNDNIGTADYLAPRTGPQFASRGLPRRHLWFGMHDVLSAGWPCTVSRRNRCPTHCPASIGDAPGHLGTTSRLPSTRYGIFAGR